MSDTTGGDFPLHVTWGSADVHDRTKEPRPRMRRRCKLDCRGANRATHVGLAGGVALIAGCELCVTRWVHGRPRG